MPGGKTRNLSCSSEGSVWSGLGVRGMPMSLPKACCAQQRIGVHNECLAFFKDADRAFRMRPGREKQNPGRHHRDL